MIFPHSMVTICPAAVRPSLLAMGQAVGVDAGMTVELSADGTAPATHYGSHAWARADFVALMTGQALPDPMPDGVTEQDIINLLSVITVSVDPVVDGTTLTKRTHFDYVASSLGVQVIASTL